MRSTNIVIFLVLLNLVAGFSVVIFPADIALATGGDGKIQSTLAELRSCDEGQVENCAEVNQPSADEITGGFINNLSVLQAIDDVIFVGPNMLANLGMPVIFADLFKSVLAFVVAFDLVEAFTGRNMS
jgi:hypothetical protein